MINWQLSKQGIRWAVSPDLIAAQVSTQWGRVFLKLSADKLLVFKWSQLKFIVLKIHFEICFVCDYGATLLRFWTQTRKFSQLFKNTGGEDLAYYGHALRLFLCSDWAKFDRWEHVENLSSVLKLVYFDSWSWQSFCVNLWCFLTVFFQACQNIPFSSLFAAGDVSREGNSILMT